MLVATLAFIFFGGIGLGQIALAQSSTRIAPGTVIIAELSKGIDAKKAKAGDKIEARIGADVLSNGQVLIPKGAKVIGHVSESKAHGKDSKDSMLGLVFDTVATKDGELTILASIQAIGPVDEALNYSTRTGFPIGAQTGPPPKGGWGQASDNPGISLDPSSKGIVGLKGLSLSRSGPASVVTSSDETVHLDSGTQLILRTEESL
jgi:hypothetical protein